MKSRKVNGTVSFTVRSRYMRLITVDWIFLWGSWALGGWWIPDDSIFSAEPRVYLGIPFTCVTVNLDLWLPHGGGWGDENFWFWQPKIAGKCASGNRITLKITSTY